MQRRQMRRLRQHGHRTLRGHSAGSVRHRSFDGRHPQERRPDGSVGVGARRRVPGFRGRRGFEPARGRLQQPPFGSGVGALAAFRPLHRLPLGDDDGVRRQRHLPPLPDRRARAGRGRHRRDERAPGLGQPGCHRAGPRDRRLQLLPVDRPGHPLLRQLAGYAAGHRPGRDEQARRDRGLDRRVADRRSQLCRVPPRWRPA